MARNWRSVNPAKYAKKDNPLGAALEGFASVYVPAVMKQKELDERRAYEEEKERKARAAAAAKAAKAQEAKDKKLAKNAKILAKQYSGSDNNGEALVFFTQQLQLTDGDVGDAMAIADRMIANGNLKFVTREVDKPLQGPDVPRDFPLTVSPDGQKPVSEFGNTGNAINAGNVGTFTSKLDEEGKETNAYKTEGDQMSEIFAPVSEEPVISLPEEGIEITPFGQELDDLDYEQLRTLEDIQMYEMQIENGDIKLSDEAKEIVRKQKEKLTGQANKAWIDEASSSEDKAYSAVVKFQSTNDTANLATAKAIYNSWKNKTKPYEELLNPTELMGKTAAELEEIKATALFLAGQDPESGALNTSFIDQKITSAKNLENDQEARKYIEKANSYNSTISQIELATAEGADDKIISRLNEIATKQKTGEIEIQLAANGIQGAQAFEGVYTNDQGDKDFGILIKMPDGTITLEDGKTKVEGRPMQEMEAKRYESIAVQTQKFGAELNAQGAAITEGLRNAETIIGLAKNDPRVRNAGGDVAQAVTNFARGTESVLEVLGDLFKGGKETVSEEELKAALAAKGYSGDGIVDAFISGDIQQLGDATAQFEASVLSFVFRAGRMEGQAGNAMSNKDFERLQEMLNVKGGINAFETTVRNFMAEKVKSYDDKVVQFNTTGPIGSFVNDYGYAPVAAPSRFSDFVTTRNEPELTTAYQNTISYVPPKNTFTNDTSGDGTQSTNDFFNGKPFKMKSSDGVEVEFTLKDVDARLKSFGLDKDEGGLGLTGDDLIQKQSSFITQMAKNMNMSVDAWVKMYQAATKTQGD